MTDSNTTDEKQPTRREAAEAKRAKRKSEIQLRADDARGADLEQIMALEDEHGDSNVSVVFLPYTPGLPTAAAVRTPTTHEIKRYRDRVKPRTKPGAPPPDVQAAADELGQSCRIYPADEKVFNALCEARPALVGQLGKAASDLACGKEADEGNG